MKLERERTGGDGEAEAAKGNGEAGLCGIDQSSGKNRGEDYHREKWEKREKVEKQGPSTETSGR
ncbi:MAG: hypothetical protein LBR53_01535 [Deltaproteobacteria bacterium]|jgi:hypothetical protein|nr:hypothetical protein [Deltaproteobacteria bacterium]